MHNSLLKCGKDVDIIPDAMPTYSSMPTPTEFLTEEETRALSAYGPPGSRPVQWRDGIIVRILLATGLRRFEIVALQPESFRLYINARWIVVKGKGSRVRWVPFPDSLYRELSQLQASLSTSIIIPAWPLNRTDLIHQASYSLIELSVHRAGIATLGRHINPHLLRHTAASLLIATGAPLQAVQSILGHSRIATTERYIHAHPRMILQAASPAFYETIGIAARQTLLEFPIQNAAR